MVDFASLVVVLWTTFTIPLTTGIESIVPQHAKEKLLRFDENELILIFTGDTQYFYPCTFINTECRMRSDSCRVKNGLAFNNVRMNKTGYTPTEVEFFEQECIRYESMLANTAQRRSIFDINRRLQNKPKALVINGDLTNYGHTRELKLFKEEWMNLPIRMLLGLGNHDYEININDCVANKCANNMLYWFVRKYGEENNLKMDYALKSNLFRNVITGSYAYGETLCTANDVICVRLLQLNNRPDYTASIQSATQWEVQSSLNWLSKELDSTNGNKSSYPVLINLHNLAPRTEKRLKAILAHWFRSDANRNTTRQVAVFSAHLHDRHGIRTLCIAGRIVPFFFVGSVPNNRFTTIKFTGSSAHYFFMRSDIGNSTTTILDEKIFQWSEC